MKKHFLLVLSSLLFSSLDAQAINCEDIFKRFSTERKGLISRIRDLLWQAHTPTLLEEFARPDLSVESMVFLRPYDFFGSGSFPRDIPTAPSSHLSKIQKGQPVYSFEYIPPKRKKEKGKVFLVFRIDWRETHSLYYEHWIYWSSNAKNSSLSESKVREVFNRVYENTYGENLDWIVTEGVIPKTLNQAIKKNLDQHAVYDIFNFNSLFFKDYGNRLKQIVAKTIASDQAGPLPKAPESAFHIPSRMMTPGMRRAILSSSYERLISDPQKIKELEFSDVTETFNTSEKIQALNMSWFSPEFQVRLLREPLWRKSITPDQVRQLDVSQNGIEDIFAPTSKDYVSRPESDARVISIDTLTDSQVMKIPRDTFLRRVFWAGDLSSAQAVPKNVLLDFLIPVRIRVNELSLEIVMNETLPREMHDYILKKMGFDVDFESMTAGQRRELFKKQIEIMTDDSPVHISRQISIIKDLIEENQRGNHDWFQLSHER